MGKAAVAIALSAAEWRELESLARAHTRPGRRWRGGQESCWLPRPGWRTGRSVPRWVPMPTRSRSGGLEVAAALRHAAAGQAARRARDTAQDRRRRHRRDHPSDPGGDAAWRHAQVLAFNGQRDGPCAADDRPHLACLRSAAAPCQDLQALHRPAVRRAPAGLAGSPCGDGWSASRSMVRDIVGLYLAPPDARLYPPCQLC